MPVIANTSPFLFCRNYTESSEGSTHMFTKAYLQCSSEPWPPALENSRLVPGRCPSGFCSNINHSGYSALQDIGTLKATEGNNTSSCESLWEVLTCSWPWVDLKLGSIMTTSINNVYCPFFVFSEKLKPILEWSGADWKLPGISAPRIRNSIWVLGIFPKLNSAVWTCWPSCNSFSVL